MAGAGLLAYEEILKLLAAAVASGLSKRRQTLLAGINAVFVAHQLIEVETTGAQVLTDLTAMNGAGVLTDGTAPLVIWLETACALTSAISASAIFDSALQKARLAVRAGGEDGSPVPPGTEGQPPSPKLDELGPRREPEILTTFQALDDFVAQRGAPVALVLYHAAWSRHSRRQLEELPELMRDGRVRGARFDAVEANTDELWQRKVRAFPTLVVHPRSGGAKTFHGDTPVKELRLAIGALLAIEALLG
jgi:hypothetical protein